jgi:hypothetical protein
VRTARPIARDELLALAEQLERFGVGEPSQDARDPYATASADELLRSLGVALPLAATRGLGGRIGSRGYREIGLRLAGARAALRLLAQDPAAELPAHERTNLLVVADLIREHLC